MALYTEKSANFLADILAADEEKRRQQALQQYSTEKSRLDNKYNNGGLGGFLGNIVGGIGKGIGDVGYALGGVFGTAGASVKDLLEGKAGTMENQNAFKRTYYGAKDDRDAALKAAGNSLNAATTLATTAIPGLGAGTTAAKLAGGALANTAAGALGGVADEFAQQGSDASLESATNRAISGAAAGLATGGLNRKIGNATSGIGSKLLNNKLATSTIGRGALSGAAGGSVGAGTSAALGGGDVAQAALQGGLSGAVSGGTQAGIMSAAGRLGNKAFDMADDTYSKLKNRNAVADLAEGIEKGADGNIKFVRMKKQVFNQINNIRKENGLDPLTQREVTAYKNAINNNLNNRFNEGMEARDVAQIAYNALTSKNSEAVPGFYENQLAVSRPGIADDYDGAVIGLAQDGGTSLKSIEPRAASQIDTFRKKGQQKIGPKSQLGSSPVGEQPVNNPIVSQNNENVNTSNMPDYTKPKDWSGAELKLDNKGVLAGLGKKLVNASKGIKNQDVYNSLYSKTAEKVTANNSIERLRDLGFEPKDYGDAAKISTATNKFFNDVVAGSKASITDPELATRLYNPEGVVFQTENLQKAYTNDVNNLLTKLEKGSAPGNYSVKDLLDESRAFSKKAATQYRKGVDINGNDIGNGRSDLGDAYMKVSQDLRSMADAGMDGLGDNYTKSQLASMLKNMGASEKVVNYMTDYDNLSDAIRKTSLFEDARQMNNEMSKTKIRRNATAGNSRNLIARVADKTGATQLLDAVTEPVGRITGTIAEKVGTGLQKADAALQNTTPISNNTNALLGNLIGRMEGQQAAGNAVQNARKAQDYQNLEDMFSGLQQSPQSLSMAQNGSLTGGYGSSYGATSQNNSLLAQIADIENGMQLALAAGDLTAYGQLADLYKNAYNTYQMQQKMYGTSESKLSTAEKNQIAKLQSAGTALDQLEELYNKAGGGQGVIGGNVANFLGGLGLNSDVNTYNQLAQGLINQIGAAIGKTDSLNTEGEVQRALSLVPKITDDNQTAMNKLATLRQLLQTNTNAYNQIYGA